MSNLSFRTKRSLSNLFALLFVTGTLALGNTSNIVSGGYGLPVALTAAPGQVLTVVVQGIDAPQQRTSAQSAPWPTTLADISATLTAQTDTDMQTLGVPLASVFPFSNCAPGGASSCGTLTGVTLQVPFEMVGPSPTQQLHAPVPPGTLKISDRSGHVATILLFPISEQAHIVRAFDTIVGGEGGGSPVVVHADGSPITADSPAKVGEILVMYAVGLGRTTPFVNTGAPSPASPLSTTQQHFSLNYDFEPNAAPSPGLPATSAPSRVPTPAPLFVGLTPGLVGLYQVNLIIIGPPSGTPPCGGAVTSNLTITLVGAASFDGAGICVAVSGP
jgi:hypothetical protein